MPQTLQRLTVRSWNHSEIWAHQDGSHLKRDRGEYIGTDKRPLFGKRQRGPHELARTHTETVEMILASRWEYVSAYYLRSFQVRFSRILSCKECVVGVRSVAQRAPLSGGYNQLTLLETGWVGGDGDRTEEKCVLKICSPIAFLSLGSIFFVFQKCLKDGCSTSSSNLYMCTERVSVLCYGALAALPC